MASRPRRKAAAEPAVLAPDLKPMEAETTHVLPDGNDWQFEPKVDGFRCIVYAMDGTVLLQSRHQKPLNRYFPEVVAALSTIAERFVLDGELVIPGEPFETLQLRLHPAESRVRLLSERHPAELIGFDLLACNAVTLLDRPLAERRAALEAFAADHPDAFRLGRATRSAAEARGWLGETGLDGLIAKRLDGAYEAGQRAMLKYKEWTTVDCVVGGLYRNEQSGAVDSLLLGLYDDDGRLNFVGRARIGKDGAEVARLLEPLIGGSGFTGRAPGGRNRWTGKERYAVPLRPTLVVEVSADHITGDTMRHGARLLRWRTDKPPDACTMDQIR